MPLLHTPIAAPPMIDTRDSVVSPASGLVSPVAQPVIATNLEGINTAIPFAPTYSTHPTLMPLNDGTLKDYVRKQM